MNEKAAAHVSQLYALHMILIINLVQEKRWQNFSEMQSYIPAGEMNQVEDAKDLVKETVKCIDNIKKNLESMNVRIITLEQKEGYKPPTPKTHRK